MTSADEVVRAPQRAPLRARTWVAIVILLALNLLALNSAANEWAGAISIGQITATVTQLLYGICGTLGAIAVVVRSRWSRFLLLSWAVFVTATAGLAPRVWGGSTLLPAIASAISGALIAAVVVMLALPPRRNTP